MRTAHISSPHGNLICQSKTAMGDKDNKNVPSCCLPGGDGYHEGVMEWMSV